MRVLRDLQVMLTELFTKIRPERIEVNILYRHLHVRITILSTATLGLPDMDPVCGPVTGTAETRCVHEGFNKGNRMPIAVLPVLIKLFQA